MQNGILVNRLFNFPIESNCFVITKLGETDCILVDPAQGEGSSLSDYLFLNKLNPSFVILTHEHYDHISSLEHLRMNNLDCK